MRDGAVVAGGWERAGGGTLGKFLGRARVVAEADFEAAGAVFFVRRAASTEYLFDCLCRWRGLCRALVMVASLGLGLEQDATRDRGSCLAANSDVVQCDAVRSLLRRRLVDFFFWSCFFLVGVFVAVFDPGLVPIEQKKSTAGGCQWQWFQLAST